MLTLFKSKALWHRPTSRLLAGDSASHINSLLSLPSPFTAFSTSNQLCARRRKIPPKDEQPQPQPQPQPQKNEPIKETTEIVQTPTSTKADLSELLSQVDAIRAEMHSLPTFNKRLHDILDDPSQSVQEKTSLIRGFVDLHSRYQDKVNPYKERARLVVERSHRDRPRLPSSTALPRESFQGVVHPSFTTVKKSLIQEGFVNDDESINNIFSNMSPFEGGAYSTPEEQLFFDYQMSKILKFESDALIEGLGPYYDRAEYEDAIQSEESDKELGNDVRVTERFPDNDQILTPPPPRPPSAVKESQRSIDRTNPQNPDELLISESEAEEIGPDSPLIDSDAEFPPLLKLFDKEYDMSLEDQSLGPESDLSKMQQENVEVNEERSTIEDEGNGEEENLRVQEQIEENSALLENWFLDSNTQDPSKELQHFIDIFETQTKALQETGELPVDDAISSVDETQLLEYPFRRYLKARSTLAQQPPSNSLIEALEPLHSRIPLYSVDNSSKVRKALEIFELSKQQLVEARYNDAVLSLSSSSNLLISVLRTLYMNSLLLSEASKQVEITETSLANFFHALNRGQGQSESHQQVLDKALADHLGSNLNNERLSQVATASQRKPLRELFSHLLRCVPSFAKLEEKAISKLSHISSEKLLLEENIPNATHYALLCEKIGAVFSPFAYSLHCLGRLHEALDAYRNSVDGYRIAIAYFSHPSVDSKADLARCETELGHVLMNFSEFHSHSHTEEGINEGVRFSAQAVELLLRHYGEHHEFYAAACLNQAQLLGFVGRLEEATTRAEKALEIFRESMGMQSEYTVSAVRTLQKLYEDTGNKSQLANLENLFKEQIEKERNEFSRFDPSKFMPTPEAVQNISENFSRHHKGLGFDPEGVLLTPEDVSAQIQQFANLMSEQGIKVDVNTMKESVRSPQNDMRAKYDFSEKDFDEANNSIPPVFQTNATIRKEALGLAHDNYLSAFGIKAAAPPAVAAAAPQEHHSSQQTIQQPQPQLQHQHQVQTMAPPISRDDQPVSAGHPIVENAVSVALLNWINPFAENTGTVSQSISEEEINQIIDRIDQEICAWQVDNSKLDSPVLGAILDRAEKEALADPDPELLSDDELFIDDAPFGKISGVPDDLVDLVTRPLLYDPELDVSSHEELSEEEIIFDARKIFDQYGIVREPADDLYVTKVRYSEDNTGITLDEFLHIKPKEMVETSSKLESANGTTTTASESDCSSSENGSDSETQSTAESQQETTEEEAAAAAAEAEEEVVEVEAAAAARVEAAAAGVEAVLPQQNEEISSPFSFKDFAMKQIEESSLAAEPVQNSEDEDEGGLVNLSPEDVPDFLLTGDLLKSYNREGARNFLFALSEELSLHQELAQDEESPLVEYLETFSQQIDEEPEKIDLDEITAPQIILEGGDFMTPQQFFEMSSDEYFSSDCESSSPSSSASASESTTDFENDDIIINTSIRDPGDEKNLLVQNLLNSSPIESSESEDPTGESSPQNKTNTGDETDDEIDDDDIEDSKRWRREVDSNSDSDSDSDLTLNEENDGNLKGLSAELSAQVQQNFETTNTLLRRALLRHMIFDQDAFFTPKEFIYTLSEYTRFEEEELKKVQELEEYLAEQESEKAMTQLDDHQSEEFLHKNEKDAEQGEEENNLDDQGSGFSSTEAEETSQKQIEQLKEGMQKVRIHLADIASQSNASSTAILGEVKKFLAEQTPKPDQLVNESGEKTDPTFASEEKGGKEEDAGLASEYDLDSEIDSDSGDYLSTSGLALDLSSAFSTKRKQKVSDNTAATKDTSRLESMLHDYEGSKQVLQELQEEIEDEILAQQIYEQSKIRIGLDESDKISVLQGSKRSSIEPSAESFGELTPDLLRGLRNQGIHLPQNATMEDIEKIIDEKIHQERIRIEKERAQELE